MSSLLNDFSSTSFSSTSCISNQDMIMGSSVAELPGGANSGKKSPAKPKIL
jgi:hypothetical protein